MTGRALRLLVVADLAAGREEGPLSIAKDAGGVDAALAALAPTLSFKVPSHLGTGDRELAVSLRVDSLSAFDPEAVARQVPALAGGVDSGGGSPLDSLLSQVELPAGTDPAVRQRAEIVNSAPFRALEAAWRGVDFLARRAGAHAEIRLEVLAASREDFLDAFFEKVFPAEHEGTAEVPLSAVVLGYEFDRGPGDVEVLRNVARMGESLRVPFLAAVGEAFWGLRQAKLLAGLPDLVRKLEGPEYAKWKGLRHEEVSLWLGLAANRVLLRSARSGDELDKPLWGSGAWALGAVLLQSFAAGGVSFPMTGQEPPALLADLGDPPVEVLLPDQKVLELLQAGLAPLVSKRGELWAHFPGVPTLHAPKRYDRATATHASAAVATLPYQAFAGAAAHVLQELGREIGPGLEADEVKRRFEEGLLAFLANASGAPAPEEVEVEVQPATGDPHLWEVLARLKPRFHISGAEVDLVLGSAVLR